MKLTLVFVSSVLAANAVLADLGLSNGFLPFNLSTFSMQLVKDSQTLYSLKTVSGGFDFIPRDKMTQRQKNRRYHLGDITFRARKVGSSKWVSGDSATKRHAVTAMTASGLTLAAANLALTLPSSSLLNITRRWIVENDILQLLFDFTNSQMSAVEIGALGIPLEFNNIFTDRTAAETNEGCSLFDPYIGQEAGYVQVTPLLGTLPPLVVLPVGQSPLEGWRFLPEPTSAPPYYQSQTFEGLYEWQFHTLAYSQKEWSKVKPWNAATSAILQSGATRTYGVQFRLAPSIREIENTVRSANRPVTSISVTPSGALTWATNNDSKSSAWVGYTITAHTWGRARLSVTYEDGTLQTVHYYITKKATQTIGDLGGFLTTSQWINSTSDPFERSPSVISYDRELNTFVKDDPRAWIPGLSDEAGAGSWLAAAMKQYAQPNAAEVAKMEQFATQTLWGSIQNTDGSVKKSVYFYEPALEPSYPYPSSIDWGNWWSWNKSTSFATDRAYDYVHVTAAYWALYRVARNYPALVKTQPWQWYLNQAVQTVTTLTEGSVRFANFGLMGETIFRLLLDDLKREGLSSKATLIESRMMARANDWAGQRYPFGSEMAWDSTAQEGIYAWAKYFNDETTALNALNSILAYQPLIPHWGYNGNARRYWDNIYGGKLQRIERQIHHYGSALNALPVISAFESSPSDYYLLRLGYGGLSGSLSNIDQGGFASASFHAFPDTLKWDGYSGDYGPGFSGHTMGIGMFLINHPDFGWQAFGGNVVATSPTVHVQICDSVRRRIYIAPLGQLLTLDAGAFSAIIYDPSARSMVVTITATPDGATGAASAPNGRLVIEQKTILPGVAILKPTTSLTASAGAYVIPLSLGRAVVTLAM